MFGYLKSCQETLFPKEFKEIENRGVYLIKNNGQIINWHYLYDSAFELQCEIVKYLLYIEHNKNYHITIEWQEPQVLSFTDKPIYQIFVKEYNDNKKDNLILETLDFSTAINLYDNLKYDSTDYEKVTLTIKEVD